MRYHELGCTDLKVSQVALGSAPFGNMFAVVSDADVRATMDRALDAGINLFDSSPFYGEGLAEERLGKALLGRRDEVLVSTKAGRYGPLDGTYFDFSPEKIRDSLEVSLELLRTDYVDIFLLHDIEFTELDSLFEDSITTMLELREEGKCRYVGVSANPMRTLRRAVTETEVDVVLSYAHHTLLNTQLGSELLPLCKERGVGVINAAAVALGLLTPAGLQIPVPATPEIKAAAARARAVCVARGVDIAFLANQFAIQRSGAPTTVVGTSKIGHLDSALLAAEAPIDEDVLDAVLAATADVQSVDWPSGLPENN